MADLPNVRIPGLPPASGASSGDLLAKWNHLTDITEAFDIGELLAGTEITQNFEWVTDNAPGYALDEVVTHDGKWWQSLVTNNLNNVPGVDPTKWVEISKSPANFAPWQAGVYPNDEVIVTHEVPGGPIPQQLQLYRLDPDIPRPYVSSDFEAELLANDWIPFAGGSGGTEHFKGVYASLAALQAAHPTADPGDYAFVDAGIGQPATIYIWDDDDSDWVPGSPTTITPDASTTVKGVVEMATQTEVDDGTATGGTTAPLVVGPLELQQTLMNLYINAT